MKTEKKLNVRDISEERRILFRNRDKVVSRNWFLDIRHIKVRVASALVLDLELGTQAHIRSLTLSILKERASVFFY